MKTKIIIIFCITYFWTLFAYAANPIFHYQPAKIILTGIVKVKIFPAPPKNEDEFGDTKEVYRYLVLDQPIDVLPQKGDLDNGNEALKNVKDLQVVKIEDYESNDSWICERCREQNQPAKRDENCGQCLNSNWSDKLVNKHVRVTGELYSRVVRIVMIANHFEEIK